MRDSRTALRNAPVPWPWMRKATRNPSLRQRSRKLIGHGGGFVDTQPPQVALVLRSLNRDVRVSSGVESGSGSLGRSLDGGRTWRGLGRGGAQFIGTHADLDGAKGDSNLAVVEHIDNARFAPKLRNIDTLARHDPVG